MNLINQLVGQTQVYQIMLIGLITQLIKGRIQTLMGTTLAQSDIILLMLPEM